MIAVDSAGLDLYRKLPIGSAGPLPQPSDRFGQCWTSNGWSDSLGQRWASTTGSGSVWAVLDLYRQVLSGLGSAGLQLPERR